MIWYKFHIGDYLSHTMHLHDAEDLAYRRLLDWYYMSEKPLPLDVAFVARRIRLDVDVVQPVLDEFFAKTPEGYINARADREIAAYNARVDINRRVGKLGGRPKETQTVAAEEQTHEVPNTKPQRPPQQNRTEQKKNISSQATRFDDFWSAWPSSKRKVARRECALKWMRHGLDDKADQIIAHVNSLKTTEQWTSGFEPAPLTYINQRRWEDETEPAAPSRRVI